MHKTSSRKSKLSDTSIKLALPNTVSDDKMITANNIHAVYAVDMHKKLLTSALFITSD